MQEDYSTARSYNIHICQLSWLVALHKYFSWYDVIASSKTRVVLTLISSFRRDVDEICSLLGYYASSFGNCLPDVSGQRIGPILTGQVVLTREDGADVWRGRSEGDKRKFVCKL